MRVNKRIDTFENDLYLVRICPVCGKEFCPAPMHIYKLPGGKQSRVCSYSCMLEAERVHEAQKKKPGRPKKKK
jgi:hypothetical protein